MTRGDTSNRWCILRTSGGKTLALARSLSAAGIEAWTPKRTFKRPKPGRASRIDGRKQMVEIEAPILPTFVFARARHLAELAIAAGALPSPHPAFSLFTYAGRHPEISNTSIAGLQHAEADAIAAIQAQREAESRQDAERIRIAAIQNQREQVRAIQKAAAERLKEMRRERRDFPEGQRVTVTDMPAFAGMTGVVESSDGRSAVVVFGGSLTMEIEGWRLAHEHV